MIMTCKKYVVLPLSFLIDGVLIYFLFIKKISVSEMAMTDHCIRQKS